MKTRTAALAALFALAGCHSQPTAGGLSPQDERDLDNAAAMLDQQNIFAAPDGQETNEADVGTPDAGAAPAANRSVNAQ